MKNLLFGVSDPGPASCTEILPGEKIPAFLRRQSIRMVVFDDDPTGIQTVHGCLLATNTEDETLSQLFSDEVPVIYILTNTRSMGPAEAEKKLRETVTSVIRANRNYGYRLIFISRSDSTLRGHFPLEPETILSAARENGLTVHPPVFFVPAFFEAGRVTTGNVQYLKEKDRLVPVSETEFARDTVFGYRNADLAAYILEKSGGSIAAEKIGSVTVPTEGEGWSPDFQEISEGPGQKEYVIVNATRYAELDRFCRAYLTWFGSLGGCSVWRTSSSLPRALGGFEEKPLLEGAELVNHAGPGLIIAGSHVRKTTLQLEKLLALKGVAGVEAGVREILSSPQRLSLAILQRIEKLMDQQITPVVYTSREQFVAGEPDKTLGYGEQISLFLTNLVRALPRAPSFLVAKGGITSHDILVKGLEVNMARVAGQIIPGVPVVITGDSNRFPGMPYIIFPGNVGDEQGLASVYAKLSCGQ